MFKVIEDQTFTHDVPVMVPVDGGFEEEQLKTVFRLIDTDETATHELSTPSGTKAFLDRVVVTFKELKNDHDEPMECTPALRDRLLKRPNVRQAVITSYLRAATKVKEGN